MARGDVLTVRVPASVVQRVDELARHRKQARSALLRDLLEAALADGALPEPDLSPPAPGEGMRLLAAQARAGDAASARHLASLQERARLLAGKDPDDDLERIWGAS